MINTKRLTLALATIRGDDSGQLYSSGRFVDLVGLPLSMNSGSLVNFEKLTSYLHYIHQDIWNLQTIALRMNWQQHMLSEDRIEVIRASTFTACDIDLFHVQYRSLFDQVAKLIGVLSGKSGQLPESFNKLRNWMQGNSDRVDPEVRQLILTCDWFDLIKETRDSIVHHSGQTMVFPSEGRILFQVHAGYKNKVMIPEIMFNDNVVDFEMYAGMVLGYLISYLEEICHLIESRFKPEKIEGGRSYHGGLAVVKNWISMACSIGKGQSFRANQIEY